MHRAAPRPQVSRPQAAVRVHLRLMGDVRDDTGEQASNNLCVIRGRQSLIIAAGKWCDSLGGGITGRGMLEEADQDFRMPLASTQIPVQLIAKLTR